MRAAAARAGEPMRAQPYIRVSTAEQAADGHSIEAQEARLRAWCEARGYACLDPIVDAGVSAGKALERRRGGKELLARMAAGQADVVVVVALNRIFRDTADGLAHLTGTHPMALQSVGELIDNTTAQGRFVLTIMLAAAQFEREQTCERNKSIATHLRAAGRPNGHTPFGCVVVDGRMFRDPVLWPVRQRIVDERGEGVTLGAIAQRLADEGVPSPTGGTRWRIATLSDIVKTHASLAHLPLHGEQPAAEEAPTHDAVVSPVAAEGATA